MKIVIAPDSYKGSLDAPGVAAAMEVGLRRVWPDADIHAFPMADGGEGTLALLTRARLRQGARVDVSRARVMGADGKPVDVEYAVLHEPDGRVAVLEAAQIVGFVRGEVSALPVTQRTSTGLGELMRLCLDAGLRHFMIGIGGTATNDGGVGVLASLGVRLFDHTGAVLPPTPAGLARLARADFSGLDARLRQTDVVILADVQHVLCGPQGATAVFGPQKGVAADEIGAIDAALARFAAQGDAWCGRPCSQAPGTGAAGGIGYALQLIGGAARLGAEVVADAVGLPDALPGSDWVLTGEGRSDAQTPTGKVPSVVARYGRRFRLPVTLVAGALDPAALPVLSGAFAGCFASINRPLSLDDAMRDAPTLIADAVEQIARLRARCAQDTDLPP